MKYLLLFVSTVACMYGCSNPPADKEIVHIQSTTVSKEEPPPPPPAHVATADSTPDQPVNVQHDNTIRLAFARGEKTITVHGIINKKGENILCYVDIGPGKTLYGQIYPDSGRANIRFNQVIMPDGKMDGPFGQSLQYPLTQKGVHTLRIGRNLMAEDPYTGGFKLVVSVE